MTRLYKAIKMTIESVLLLVLSIGTAPVVQDNGAVHFVATYGNDSNPGTLGEPWRTIAKANRELLPGETVCIRAGIYNEIIEPLRSGTADNQIRYIGYPGETVRVQGESGTAKVVYLENRSHVVLDRLTISYEGPPPSQDARWPLVLISGDSQHNVIRGCTIKLEGDPLERYRAGHREIGVLIRGGKHNTVEYSHIAGVWQGIKLQNIAQYNVLQGNTIGQTSGESIVVDSSKGVIQGSLIQGNFLEGSITSDGIQTHADYDLSQEAQKTDTSNRGIVIRDNIIRYHGENAIDLKAASNVVIEGNVIYGVIGSNNGPLEGWNHNAIGTISRGSNKSAKDVIIRNNLIYDSSAGIKADEGYKIYGNTIVANNRDYAGPDSDWTSANRPAFWGILQREIGEGRIAIQNNIMVGHNGVEVALRLTEAQTERNHIDKNLYYNPRGVFFADYTAGGDWESLTFTQWQRRLRAYESVTGDDESSLIADPLFVNAPERPVGEHDQFDFHLRDGSPAIDAGGPLTKAVGAGSGNQVRVEDAGYFFDGYGVTEGDLIQIGRNSPVRVTSVDYENDVITIDRNVSWKSGDGVGLPYRGPAPDLGAYEYEGDSTPVLPLAPALGAKEYEEDSTPVLPLAPETRVTDGLQALYTFEEGGGATVQDVAGVGRPLDLRIEDPPATSWLRGALSLDSPTVIRSKGPALKIVEACRDTNEITLEVWIRPANTRQSGPARIVTLSAGVKTRNLTLGQGLWGDRPSDLYDVRLRTTEQSENGEPSLSSTPGSANRELTHVVYTRDAAGLARLFVNNEIRASGTVGGDLSSWDAAYPLVLGNEPTGERPWLGEMHLVAIYCRALGSSEIQQNYVIGLPSSVIPR
jgi:hypothetical protein